MSGFLLPTIINPPETISVCVPVPNDAGHRQAFAGVLYMLSRWYNWEKDALHRGKDAANVWMQIFLNVTAQMDAGGDCEMAFDVRQNPENPCELQKSLNGGVSWETFAILTDCATPFDIRQNPENPCEIEKTTDGGETWELAFNLQSCPPLIEYVNGVLSISTDGGMTWTPVTVQPYDPVYDDPPPPNPRPETEPNDKRCSAAYSALTVYTDLANRFRLILEPNPLPFLAAGSFAGVLQTQLNFFMTGNFFNDLSANAAFQLNATSYITTISLAAPITMADYFLANTEYSDSDTQEALRCALYCAMDDNGIISFSEAIDALNAQPDMPPAYVEFIELLGGGGLSAAISAHANSVPASECDDCGCEETWCQELLIGETMPSWVYATFGTLTDETLQGTADGAMVDAWWWGVLRIDFPDTTTITRIVYDTQGTATRDSGSAAWLIQVGEGEDFDDIIDLNGFGNPTGWSTGVSSEAIISLAVDRLNFDVFARCNAWSDGFAWMTKIRLEGTGTNPFEGFGGACEE